MRFLGVLWLTVLPIIGQAQQGDTQFEVQGERPARWVMPPSPALPPTEAIKTVRVASGFSVELVASEPMVQDPILAVFDPRGRLWVLEMRGFMPDVDGRGENRPVGRVSVLEDRDADSRMDVSTVFLDDLVMPRAIALVGDGLLVVSGGRLIVARDSNADGRADRQEMVDEAYASVGNVEHQPNGLMRGLDNWYYNAKSRFRYRLIDGRWFKERTEFRGQWGIAQDDEGRLYYNVNYSQLHADVAPPNYFKRNPAYFTGRGLNVALTTNQQVFPSRMNTGVNRAYRPGVLDAEGRLREFTSASAPWVYRGDLFDGMRGDVFVCEPAGNLIKRNRVLRDGLSLRSEAFYEASEFLASTDERFRPVSVVGGPDGALYVVDMYRGVIQHKEYVTTFLRKEILARGLDRPVNLGRIYRIVDGKGRKPPDVFRAVDPDALLAALGHADGWHRDTAQRLLVERGSVDVLPRLIEMARSHGSDLGRMHALWSVEGLVMREARADGDRVVLRARGLGKAEFDRLRASVRDPEVRVRVAALRVLEALSGGDEGREHDLLEDLKQVLATESDERVRFQALLSAGGLRIEGVSDVLSRAIAGAAGSALMRDAVLTSPLGLELEILERWAALPECRTFAPGRDLFVQALASGVVKGRDCGRINRALDVAVSMASGADWMTSAILAGWVENAPDLRVDPLVFPERPGALVLLASFQEGRFSKSVERIESSSEWPGHAVERVKIKPLRPLTDVQRQVIESGREVFLQVCAGCHGVNGEGMDTLAPPLVDSEIVRGAKKHLILLVLHGIEGPVTVGGRRYQPPAVQPNMPSLEALSDMQIGGALSYVRRVLGRVESLVSSVEVAEARQESAARARPWTQEELMQVDPRLRTRERW